MAAVLVPFYTQWGGPHADTAVMAAERLVHGVETSRSRSRPAAVRGLLRPKWSIVLGAATTAVACLVYASTPR